MEYGDYECPVCGNYYAAVKQVAAKYNDEIYFQFRNLPLTQIHPNAFAGARAAEAAGLQGKYWQMHDMLYENQNSWATVSNPLTAFQGYAQQIGLDMNKFNSDYGSSQVNDAIQADLNEFNKTGQQEATPTFFLDGQYIGNEKLGVFDKNGQIIVDPTVANFSKYIDAAIAAKH
jgi:protein-disulfide isomerase